MGAINDHHAASAEFGKDLVLAKKSRRARGSRTFRFCQTVIDAVFQGRRSTGHGNRFYRILDAAGLSGFVLG